MPKIINFFDYRQEDKEKINNQDLTALLKKAKQQTGKQDFSKFQNELALTDFDEFKRIIKAKIFDALFKQELIDSDYFHCGEYISKLITRTAKEPPSSWYALDYIGDISEENDYHSWQRAADICFLICSIFIERSEFRAMNHRDYVDLGRMFYQTYFDKSKKNIGYLMSKNYKCMAEVTQNSFYF
ncbi:MAG: hypothetical protein ACOCVY_01890 [Patescibacteria group bacterium]